MSRRWSVTATVVVVTACTSGLLVVAQQPQQVGDWSAGAAITDSRTGTGAATLQDGRTLLTGGRLQDDSVTDSVVIYDPLTNGFEPVGQLDAPRVGHTATLLADGRVLIVGGSIDNVPTAEIEILDLTEAPNAQGVTFSSLNQARTRHAAARLLDGRVLIVGGNVAVTPGATTYIATDSAEMFEPDTGLVVPVSGSLNRPRAGASATTTIDGRVLIAGGANATGDLKSAELFYDGFGFDLLTTELSVARSGHTALLLPHNNSVLVAGGTSAGAAVATADLFVPAEFPDPYSWGVGAFVPAASMPFARSRAFGGPSGDNGFVFVAGGGAADSGVYRFATIRTDKHDYAPGEPAVISGSGWQPGEPVKLVFQEDPAVHDDYTLTIVANDQGEIYWDQWAPDQHDLGVRFYLTARDSVSRAQITFTDDKRLTINFAGTGGGTVGFSNLSPATTAASCTATCDRAFDNNQTGTLTATPAPGSVFTGWSGVFETPGTTTCSGAVTSCTFALANKAQVLTATFTAAKITPVITWNNPSDITFGSALGATQLNATATVAGTFAYTPAAGAVLSAGNAQTLSVTFTPSDTTTYNSATRSVSINVLKATPVITWGNPGDITYGTALGATQLNATASVPGSLIYTPAAGAVLNAGNSQALTVDFTPTDASNYNAVSKTVNLNVLKVTPVISWSTPADIVYGTLLGDGQLNATADVAGALVYTPAAGTKLNAGTHSLTVDFTPADANNYNTASKTVSLIVLKATPVISWINPADITYGTLLGAGQLNATADVDGAMVYTPAANTKLNAGTHSLTVDFTPTDTTNYNGASKTVSLTVLKATPVISWSNPADITYGTLLGAGQLNATADVDGAMVYTPAANTKLNAGTHGLTVDFTPTDTANYNGASKTVSLTVLKATPVISWSNPADVVYGALLGAGQLNATADVDGAMVYTPAADTKLNAGTHGLTVDFTPADATNYNGASKTVSLTVLKATPVISWSNPADITYGTLLGLGQLNATADVDGAMVYTPAADTKLNAGTHSLTVDFTPTDTANYNGASKTVSLVVLKATPVISWSNPADIVYGALLGAGQLNATADVDGAMVYTPAADTKLNAGTHSLTVDFTPADTANYNGASKTVSLTVLKATPVISWSNPADIVYGALLGAGQLNATADVDGAMVYTPAAGTKLNAGTHGLTVDFTPTDTANYNGASKTVSLTVLKATPVISWSNPADIVYGALLGAGQLNATADVDGAMVYTPAADTKLNAGTHSLTVDFTPTDTANYNGASKTVSLTVLKATPVISWSNPADIIYGALLGAGQLNATADVDGAMVYTPAAGTKLNAGTHGLTVDFTPTDTANYNSASKTVSLTVLKATPVISWSTPADIIYGTPLSATQLNATASVVGTLVYTPVSGTELNAGSGQTLTVNFAPADNANYNNASKTVTINVVYGWSGFRQPINDTAHQVGVAQSKFKLGQTIPAKFVIRNAAGNVIQQSANPTFTRTGNLGACDANAAADATETVTPDGVPVYGWDGAQYHYNWSTKGLSGGRYRIYANLLDGTQRFVDICLTK